MFTKHFLKTLIIFTGIIFLGLMGIFLVSYLDEQEVNGDTGFEVAE
jgi:hypothetical protein